MSNDDDDLPFGLYERLVTAGLKARLLRFDSNTARIVTKELDPAEAHATLARHVANVVARALNALPQEDRATAQSELTNQIISLLAGNPATGGPQDDLVEIPPEELRAIEPIGTMPNAIGTSSHRWSRCPPQTSWLTRAGSLASPTRWRTRFRPPIPSTCCALSCDGMDCGCSRISSRHTAGRAGDCA